MTYEAELPEHAIAVIGMSGRFPGAPSVEDLWRLVVAGEEGSTSYGDEELAAAGVTERLLGDPDYVRAGFPLEGFDLFDAGFFGVPRSEAELMDPQHRLLLETAWHALERAGYPPRSHIGRTGVFAGTSASTYLLERIAHGGRPGEVSDEMQVAIGSDPGMLAQRVSYKLGLTGPSLTVQCACSSSLVTVHLAVQSLLARECDVALAGGVAVRALEPSGYRYEQGAILAADGHCRPFDAAATGTVDGDGVALVVLKRLEEAVADGDHVHVVIRGSAVNNDGSAKAGFTAPSARGQAEVIAEALAVAEVEPGTVDYVEAHGTGTPLGDPIEVQALAEAFGTGVPAGSVHLGSAKSNVGHLDAAAGVTGLIKAALALEHRYIPPTAHYRSPNPRLSLETTPFRVDAEGVEWPVSDHPPRAGVSAFGIGGTNAHVVLEAAPGAGPVAEKPADQWHILPLSARTPEALDEAAVRLADTLGSGDSGAGVADVAYTLQRGRAEFPYRRAVVADGLPGAAAALGRPAGAAVPVAEDGPAPDVVFLFPGQGSQYAGMGAELYRTEPVFRDALDRCAELLLPHLGWNIRDVAFDAGPGGERLRQTLYTQPTVFSLDYALARLLISWGVTPSAMTGHSVGELVAACLAGVFTLEDALRVVAKRARLMQDLPPGRMLSVLLDEAALEKLLDGRATIAAVNAPASCVVAGTPEEIAEVRALLAEHGVSVRELETSHAFHTALVEPALPGLAEVLREVRLGKPTIPFLSNVTGTWITDEKATDPEYWVDHTRSPVRFSDDVAALGERAGPAVYVEVGPGSQLSGLVRAHLEAAPVATLLPRPRGAAHAEESRTVREGLGELWRHGVPVDWTALHRGARRHRVPLPGYPFERRSYLLPKPDATPESTRRDPADWTYAPVWFPAPLPPSAVAEPLTWLVLADDEGLADGVTEGLRADGHRVTTVRMARTYARTSDDSFDADPAEHGHLQHVVDELRQSGLLPDRVVHAWSVVTGTEDGRDAEHRYAAGLDTGFHSLVSLAQALGEAGQDRPVRVDVLTNDLQDAYGSPVRAPERATLYGAVTVLPQEYAWLSCRSVDVTLSQEATSRARLTAQLLPELAAAPDAPLVAYRGPHRLHRTFTRVPLTAVPVSEAWREGAGYLVTGASGEVGLAFAEELAEAGARLQLIGDPDFPAVDTWADWLSGAASDDDRVRGLIARLSALCSSRPDTVRYRAVDLTDPGAAAHAVMEAREHLGSLRGVLHCADIRGSGLVAPKSRTDFAAVLGGRVRSTLLLDELLRADDLDFFLLGSATTGIVGGFGQAENTAAAAFLDAFAQAGSAAGRRRTAIDWSQWDWDDWFERQMAELPEVRDRYERLRREQGIPVADGLALARAVLAGGLPQVVASSVDFQDVLADQTGLDASSFTDSLEASRGPADDDWDPAAVWPDNELAQSVARVWRDMLGVSPIGPDEDFYDLGGNSLFAIQIVGRLRQLHGDFPMSAVFEAPTVDGLTAAIRAHQAESIGLDEFEALLREVENLSAEEAEAMLRGDDV